MELISSLTALLTWIFTTQQIASLWKWFIINLIQNDSIHGKHVTLSGSGSCKGYNGIRLSETSLQVSPASTVTNVLPLFLSPFPHPSSKRNLNSVIEKGMKELLTGNINVSFKWVSDEIVSLPTMKTDWFGLDMLWKFLICLVRSTRFEGMIQQFFQCKEVCKILALGWCSHYTLSWLTLILFPFIWLHRN